MFRCRREMPSHFSTIGFALESQSDMADLVEKAVTASQEIRFGGGRYLRFRGGGGEEVWIQEGSDGAIVGINPHFTGRSVVRVGVAKVVRRDIDSELDGGFSGHADPDVDDPLSGACRVVFDCPDFGATANLKLPSIVTAQVAAFAHDIQVHATFADFDALRRQGKIGLASRSFIPTGMFTPEMSKRDPPDAFALITGHVMEAEEKVNPITGSRYFWALVDTLGGRYDAVIDPSLVTVAPRAGGVISGSFWLSGRIVDFPN